MFDSKRLNYQRVNHLNPISSSQNPPLFIGKSPSFWAILHGLRPMASRITKVSGCWDSCTRRAPCPHVDLFQAESVEEKVTFLRRKTWVSLKIMGIPLKKDRLVRLVIFPYFPQLNGHGGVIIANL